MFDKVLVDCCMELRLLGAGLPLSDTMTLCGLQKKDTPSSKQTKIGQYFNVHLKQTPMGVCQSPGRQHP